MGFGVTKQFEPLQSFFVGDPSLWLDVEADSRPFRFLLIDLNLLPALGAGDHFPSRLSAQIQLVSVDEIARVPRLVSVVVLVMRLRPKC